MEDTKNMLQNVLGIFEVEILKIFLNKNIKPQPKNLKRSIHLIPKA